MHRLVRLFGWTVLVAILVGVLWPERQETVASGTLAQVRDPAPSQARAAQGPPAAALGGPPCSLPCGLLTLPAG